jgi:hypothetical protein
MEFFSFHKFRPSVFKALNNLFMFKALNQYIQTSNKVREPGRQLEAMD